MAERGADASARTAPDSPHASSLPPWQRYALAVGIVAYLTKVVATVQWADLATYPVTFPDSYDWLTNGLYYARVPLEPTWRSMLNPLVFGGLFALRLENAIPYLGPLYLGTTIVVLLTLGRRVAGDAAAFAAVLIAANHFVLAHALAIGSDTLAIGLATTGLLVFQRAIDRPRALTFALAGVLFGLSVLAQPAAQLFAPVLVVLFVFAAGRNTRTPAARVRDAAVSPQLWSTGAAWIASMAAVVLFRGAICGQFLPHSTVAHDELLTFSLRNGGYYLWSSVAAWSIPTALLAAVGLVAGWRTHPRIVLGAVLSVVANAVFFVFFYGWRDNRFVLYWSWPVFLLAGFGLAALPRRAAWAALAVAAYWGNLTMISEPAPDRTALVWLPGRAAVFNYFTDAIEPPSRPVTTFTRCLRTWSREQQARFRDPAGDDPSYSREGDIVGRLAALHTHPTERLYLHVGPDEPAFRPYMLRNQFILAARRAVNVTRLDPAATPPLPPHAKIILRRAELDRLRAAGMPLAPLEVRPIYCLARLGRPAP